MIESTLDTRQQEHDDEEKKEGVVVAVVKHSEEAEDKKENNSSSTLSYRRDFLQERRPEGNRSYRQQDAQNNLDNAVPERTVRIKKREAVRTKA